MERDAKKGTVGKGTQRKDCGERDAEKGLWGKECRHVEKGPWKKGSREEMGETKEFKKNVTDRCDVFRRQLKTVFISVTAP